MEPKRTVAFHTLGCKLNFSETSTLSRMLEKDGFEKREFDGLADVYVINTCSVTDNADKECRQLVRRIQRKSPESLVVITGCYAQLKPAEIAAIPGVDLVLGAAEKFNLAHHLKELTKGDSARISSCEIEEVNGFTATYSLLDRTRSFLKVQDGCSYNCSFCTIPMARGKSRSDTIENVLANARELAANGVKEIVLTGVNLGDFGLSTPLKAGLSPLRPFDPSTPLRASSAQGKLSSGQAPLSPSTLPGTDPSTSRRTSPAGIQRNRESFYELVQALDAIEGIERFRISSIEPNLLSNSIIEFVANSNKFMPHFHIPLQSGSNTVLALMRRRYQRELYAERVRLIKTLMPHCCIGVDVIVGFPGETETEFNETLEFLHGLDISYLHVFTYSERDNTKALEIKPVVPINVRHQRNKILRNLSYMKMQYFTQQHAGQTRKVLFEANHKSGMMEGYTDNYIKVTAPFKSEWVNDIVDWKLG
jgi:threonylcarbamoyladenosine tRNA methylthiotransferase MtaB